MPRQSLPSLLSENGAPPFFQSLQKEMNQVFDRFRGPWAATSGDWFGADNGALFPALDIAETDEAVEITAEVPGVKEDDLDVSIAGGILTLKGEKSSDHEEKEEDYHLIERRYGSFRRQVPLGFSPQDGAVDAKFTDGVLKLRVAKPAEAKAKVHKIKIEKT